MHITIATLQAAAPAPRRGHLRCPLCQSEQVAPIALASTSLAGQRGIVSVDGDGVHLGPTAAAVEGGSAISISITFRCRASHLFVLRLRSIYDSTTVETLVLPITSHPTGIEASG